MPYGNGSVRYFPRVLLAMDQVEKRATGTGMRNQMAFCYLTCQPKLAIQAGEWYFGSYSASATERAVCCTPHTEYSSKAYLNSLSESKEQESVQNLLLYLVTPLSTPWWTYRGGRLSLKYDGLPT